jgi:hypothetical protein
MSFSSSSHLEKAHTSKIKNQQRARNLALPGGFFCVGILNHLRKTLIPICHVLLFTAWRTQIHKTRHLPSGLVAVGSSIISSSTQSLGLKSLGSSISFGGLIGGVMSYELKTRSESMAMHISGDSRIHLE